MRLIIEEAGRYRPSIARHTQYDRQIKMRHTPYGGPARGCAGIWRCNTGTMAFLPSMRWPAPGHVQSPPSARLELSITHMGIRVWPDMRSSALTAYSAHSTFPQERVP